MSISRTLRISLTIGGVVVVLLAVTPFVIPANQFRPAIEQKASAALGRKVGLGRLSLSLSSGSLSAESLAVGDDPTFSTWPFLTASGVTVRVELVPLIVFRSLNVTGITIEHPEVTLIRNSAGHWNFSSLGSFAGASSAFSFKKLELNDGRILVGSKTQRRTYDRANITVWDVSLASASPVIATAALPGGGTFRLAGTIGPLNRSDASLTPLDATVAVGRLNLASTGLLDPSAGLAGLLDLRATIASKHGEAEVAGSATLSKVLLVAGGTPASQPVVVEFNTKYDLNKHSGSLNPSTLKLAGAAAHLQGTYDVGEAHTVVNIKTAAAPMPAGDLESFLPAVGIHLPKGARLAAGMFVANLNTVGATNRLVTTGNVGLFNVRLSGFDLGANMRAISAFTGLNTGKDLDIEEMTTNLRMAPDGLRFDHLNGVVRSLGHVTGAGTIDARNNLDFGMVVTLTSAPGGGVGGAVGTAGALNEVLGMLTGDGAKSQIAKSQITGQRIPFLVRGTTSDPRFIPDVSGLVIQMLKGSLSMKP